MTDRRDQERRDRERIRQERIDRGIEEDLRRAEERKTYISSNRLTHSTPQDAIAESRRDEPGMSRGTKVVVVDNQKTTYNQQAKLNKLGREKVDYPIQQEFYIPPFFFFSTKRDKIWV